MNQMTPPPQLEIIPPSAPFSEATAFLAERLSWSECSRSTGPTPLSAELGGAVLQRPPAMATTAKRPGTTRPCRLPTA